MEPFSVIAGHWWFSGRILACHAGGPGSIPGQCILFFFFSYLFSFVTSSHHRLSEKSDSQLMSVLNCVSEKRKIKQKLSCIQ